DDRASRIIGKLAADSRRNKLFGCLFVSPLAARPSDPPSPPAAPGHNRLAAQSRQAAAGLYQTSLDQSRSDQIENSSATATLPMTPPFQWPHRSTPTTFLA